MKKIISILIYVLLVPTNFALAQQDIITFTSGSSPSSYQNRMTLSLLEEAFSRNGYKFNVKYYPSPRSLLMSNSGKEDGELHRVYEFHKISNGKYKNLIRIESQLMSVYLAVFATNNSSSIHDWSDLKGKKIGYLRGRKNVEKHLKPSTLANNTIFPQSSEEGLFRMLLKGRLDYVISESYEGNRLINANKALKGIKEIVKLEKTNIYAYANKKHRKLARKIAQTLQQMKIDGSFARITHQVKQQTSISSTKQ